MTRRPKPPPAPESAHLSPAQMKAGIERINRRISDLENFNVDGVTERWSSEVKALQTSIEETLSRVFGHDTVEYQRYQSAASLDDGPVYIGGRSGPQPFRDYLRARP